MMSRILVVDDEQNICELLSLYLVKEGYTVETAGDGEEAIKKFQSFSPDLVLLDIMLPKKDGWAVCREIRQIDNTPIIMLSAKGETFDKVLGLELGADDYVTKPFDSKEVMARIKTVLRRVGHTPDESRQEVEHHNLYVSLTNYKLVVAGKQVEAPPKEIELLYHLAKNPNRVFTRDQLLDEIWGFKYFGDSRTVDVHIKRIREKLEGVSDRWAIRTVWGIGYKFETVE
ncbi:MAG: response regulator transcription factor [Clostridia bacterium]|nr:response regulator transcription factor [Clostridia bacterium]